MYRFWDAVLQPILEAARPRTIVEIGSDTGLNTRNLLAFARQSGGLVHVIDPLPKYDVDEWQAEYGSTLVFHRSLSLSALPVIDDPDVVLIDGDHNWYTVVNELRTIEGQTGAGRFPLVLLHDVGWPYGRRDLYYDPSTIPDEHLQPHRRAGMLPGQHDLVAEGGVNDHLRNAVYENTPRNGVLTAVEDFIDGSELDLSYTVFPGIHGLCLLHEASLGRRYPEFRQVIDDLQLEELTRRGVELVERHRIKSELRFKDSMRSLEEAHERHARDVELLRSREEDLREEIGSLAEARDEARRRVEELEGQVTHVREEAAAFERDVLHRAANERKAAVERERELERQHQIRQTDLEAQVSERDDLIGELERDLRGVRRDLTRLRGRRSVRLALWLAQLFRPLFRSVRGIRTGGSRSQDRPTEAPAPPQQEGTPVGAPPPSVPPQAEADVVVCVHDAPDDVRRCLRSVGEHTNLHRHHLIIVDDGSDAPTRELLDGFVMETGATLERRETAGGYTVAANTGIAASTKPFVVLLNSDTVVGPGWLERMLECATSMPDVGVVGPLSNAASWQTVPVLTDEDGTWHVNELPESVTVADVATAVAERSPGLYPQVPLVNGFCYLISRRAIDELGPLDEQSFPRGYGEEDDFSIRALDAGFRHYVVDTCYVYHGKSRSYSADGRSEIVETSKVRLRERHGADRIRALVDEMRYDEELVRARTSAGLIVEEVGERPTPPDLGLRSPRIAWLQPHLEQAGGIRRAIEMSNRLVSWGAQVDLATPEGVRSSWLPIRANVLSLERAREENYDVLIGSDPDMVDPFREISATVRVNYHLAPYMLYRPSDERLAEYYRPAEDIVHVANSTWTAEQVSKLVDVEFRGVFPGGIDRTLFRPVRAEQTHDVVCYGSRRPHKGTAAIESAAEGLSLLKMEGENARQHELAYLIASGRVFVSAAWHEGFNFCPLEAMACGVPVVMTDDGGSREYVVHGENALVVRPEDAVGLRDGIDRLLEDRMLRAELIKNGLRTAWEFDWDTTTARFAELLLKTLDQG